MTHNELVRLCQREEVHEQHRPAEVETLLGDEACARAIEHDAARWRWCWHARSSAFRRGSGRGEERADEMNARHLDYVRGQVRRSPQNQKSHELALCRMHKGRARGDAATPLDPLPAIPPFPPPSAHPTSVRGRDLRHPDLDHDARRANAEHGHPVRRDAVRGRKGRAEARLKALAVAEAAKAAMESDAEARAEW